ncbi:hydroxypyruvate isomerase family protein [Adhaeretor mobilis]|uniref:Hydroxypyruvate isomerase n=1 Tax=Adhaeretor mobilis TaxID=1930276 RepID=A0A517MRZ1_9BACT|nr:TIM barrel protein [Adhaeretor mobilis]QDS97651.1 Hydroxypyruvate isomerase [Adhaeretor mobilis]
MQRRELLKNTGLAAASLGVAGLVKAQDSKVETAGKPRTFKLKYAPHFGQFVNSAGKANTSEDLIDQLKFAADQGFTAWEDNGMKGRPVELQERIAKTMEQLGMTMGVFVAHADFSVVSFAGTDKAQRDRVLQDVKDSVEVAKRVNAKWMTVVPDKVNDRLEPGYQAAHCIDLLRQCCEILEPHGLVMVLEPLNWWANHPGLFLNKIPQAFEICRAVDSPSCKILFDIYHQQIQEGNLIPNIDLAWSEIAYFQCGDNPGRKEPGTGEINYRNVFKHIHSKGFAGVMGMEHGLSKSGVAGEQALIDAYVGADDF